MDQSYQSRLEKFIRAYLLLYRERHPDFAVPMLLLYTETENQLGTTAAHFNKTISDLKRAGIVGTAKGGEVVFLSDPAWKLQQQLKVVGRG
jgi:hypothetical protein